MKIAFDIDDVVAKYTYKMMQNAVIWDKEVAKSKRGVVNIHTWITHGMFDWTREEADAYNKVSIPSVYKHQRVINNAKQMISLLRKQGHEILFVTARGVDKHSNRKTTTKWLKEQGIEYDKLFFKVKDKVKVLTANKVDIFIDDGYDQCDMADKAGIYTIQHCDFAPRHRKFKRQINSYQEIYDTILKLSNSKPLIESLPIIVDTDVSDEIDDEFALAYLFSFERANIAAVTIAPHFQLNPNVKDVDIEKNVERSFQRATKLAKIARKDVVSKIYKGDVTFQGFGKWKESEAVRKIIEICRANEKVIFISLGEPVNLAHALQIAPDIANKIKLYALLGELVPNALAPEHNMSQDFPSTKVVLEKIKDKTIFPATGFSNLIFTLDDMKIQMSGQNNAVLNLLLKDFESVMKEKFGSWRYKSMFDIVVPYYLAHPVNFIENKQSIKLNNTHVLFKPSKNVAYFATNIVPDLPISDFFERMKKFDKTKRGEKHEN